MQYTRRDFLVGLFILTSVGIMLGTLIVTSNILERRIPIYVSAPNAEGINPDTRVFLRGLQVGRVSRVTPQVDSTDLSVSFVARMSIQSAFADGTRLQLPVGTVAVIEQPNPINPHVVRLELPEPTPATVALQPGDTIPSRRPESTLEALEAVMAELKNEVVHTLADSRALMEHGAAGVLEAQHTIASSTPLIHRALERLVSNLERTDAFVADLTPRIAPLYDSLTVTLARTHQVVARLDTLSMVTGDMVSENRAPIHNAIVHLENSARILEHFTDQVRRRPTRLLTGVGAPPPPDTTDRRP